MLLDQKRTRRIVQVVAVLTSIAFVGVIFVVLALTVFGSDSGGGHSGGVAGAGELIADAEEAIEEDPNDAEAWEDLASAHAADNNLPEAITAAKKSAELAPNEFRRTQTLVALEIQNNNQDGAVDALSAFTNKNPDNADAFLQLGLVAEQAGRTQLARLSFEKYIALNPDDPSIEDVRQRLENIESGQVTPATGGGN